MDLKIMKPKTDKPTMTESEAFALIRQWGDEMEVRLKGDDFEAVQDEIWLAVKNERLTFDSSTEIFTYVLKKPILMKDGSGQISIINIVESDMNGKKNVTKQKNDIDVLAELFHAYCRGTDGEQIETGFLSRIKDRDQAIISAVIMGFFVQAVPSKQG